MATRSLSRGAYSWTLVDVTLYNTNSKDWIFCAPVPKSFVRVRVSPMLHSVSREVLRTVPCRPYTAYRFLP